MLSILCTLLLPEMTGGGRCLRRKNMAASGAQERERGTAEESLPLPADSPMAPPGTTAESVAFEIDYFSQARKALSERSPFEDEASTSGGAVTTLPSSLSSLLNRHGSDNRRRHKKSHSGGEKKKKSSRASEKPRASNIWAETEEYFRDMTLSDIDTLVEASSLSSLGSRECFLIPRLNVVSCSEDEKKDAPRLEVTSLEDDKKCDEVRNGECSLGIESVDNVADEKGLPEDDKNDSCYSLEWLLGCRSKVSLTSERPTKKRKLLGGDAGLQKVLMTSPCDGGQPFCHYCGRVDSGRDSNRLVVCASCKVAVHQKCYGVQDGVDESWLCSWCKEKGGVDESTNPCVLCPTTGGALKPVSSNVEGAGSVEFVHLFCGLWMPEVYIDDLKKMEPVMNVGGIKETRRKLVCNVCKLKCGACVRCSHGSCRTSFHPLCGREARHRMEIWAKYGDDNVELRSFCLKHSDLRDAVGSEFSEVNGLPPTLPVNSEHDLRIGCRNGEVTSNSSLDKLNNDELQDVGLSDSIVSAHDMLGCGAVHQDNDGAAGKSKEDVDASDSRSFAIVLKKLIDRGKVDVKDVAMEIGISSDTLTANINKTYMDPDVLDKIVNWLKAHVYTSAFQKGLKVKFKPPNVLKDQSGAADGSDTLPISDSGLLDPVAVKSVPPRRRTVSNIRILKDNKVICSSEGVTSENGMPIDNVKVGQSDHENPGSSNEASPDATVMNLTMSEETSPKAEGNVDKPFKSNIPEEKSTFSLQNDYVLSDRHCPVHSASELPDSGSMKAEAISSYIHPFIKKKLLQIHNGVLLEDIICPREEGISSLVESSVSNSQNQQLTSIECSSSELVNMEQLHRAGKMEHLEFSPEDEIEGELIYLQYRLLRNAVERKRLTDNLICNVAKSLPHEIDAAHQQRWDSVIVNQYLRDLREAKKQGRKEKRHKEAQAVLAAATAAAAASSRVSSFRKDSLDESMQQENLLKFDASSGRSSALSQPMPRAKETLSRVAVTRTSSEKYSDFGLPSADLSKEQARSCDVCRRSDTMLNPILVCSGCKVAVHLDCYRSVKETTGPWYCELCEDLSSRSSVTSAINIWEKPVTECALCGGTSGAFRKSSDGQWVHAFCAEWTFESTFRRGQVNAVEGMETVLKGVDTCCICRGRHGVCMKCCYGNCQTTFHPSCARSAGFYMNVRTAGGKSQHRAYCEKHSLEQKAKSESQKHGIEEFKSMKQVRVELERLRLLCERIVKREKIKRELVLCSHDILAFKRDHVARSVLARSPFIMPDVSSESATTSLKGNTEGYRSCSDAVQRSDDITVDSSVSAMHHVRVAVSMDTDPKLEDDCSTSQSHYNHSKPERIQFAGKQIPRRASAMSVNLSDVGGLRSKSRKHAETFGKELIMTSDEASMKNLRLPKGYAYVPADCLSNDKQSNEDEYASGPVENDR